MAELRKLGELGRSEEGERERTVGGAARVMSGVCARVCALPGWSSTDLQKTSSDLRHPPKIRGCFDTDVFQRRTNGEQELKSLQNPK